MKILYHHRTLGDGAEGIHVAEMVKAFRALGHEVQVESLIGEQTNADTRESRRWQRIAGLLPKVVYEIGEIGYNVAGYRALMKAAREFKPDLIYDRYISYNYSAIAVARRFGIPCFLEVNSPYAYQRREYETLYFPGLLQTFERKTCSDASCVIVVSTPLKEHLIEMGIPGDHIVVMANGADPLAFTPEVGGEAVRRKYGIADRTVIGFVGILRDWHGIDLLVEAFDQLQPIERDLHLLIVGDGPIRGELESLIQQKRIEERVSFTGRLPHSDVTEHVAAMDIAVSPRATFYASPMKILEYMAMAKPVVGPDMGNIRDIIDHGREGLLFEPESVDSIREQLDILLRDRDMRERFGAIARRKIETRLNWHYNARWVLDLYQRILTEEPLQAFTR